MSLKKRTIKFKPRIKLNHNISIGLVRVQLLRMLCFWLQITSTCLPFQNNSFKNCHTITTLFPADAFLSQVPICQFLDISVWQNLKLDLELTPVSVLSRVFLYLDLKLESLACLSFHSLIYYGSLELKVFHQEAKSSSLKFASTGKGKLCTRARSMQTLHCLYAFWLVSSKILTDSKRSSWQEIPFKENICGAQNWTNLIQLTCLKSQRKWPTAFNGGIRKLIKKSYLQTKQPAYT